jgi:hypothetical protein
LGLSIGFPPLPGSSFGTNVNNLGTRQSEHDKSTAFLPWYGTQILFVV